MSELITFAGRPTSAEERRRLLSQGFTHDTRNALGSAVHKLYLVEQTLESGVPPDVQRNRLAQVRSALRRVTELVDSIDELAHLDGSEVPLAREAVDLRALVERVVEDLDLSGREGLSIVVEDVALPPITTDPRRVWQVVENLLGNVVKYADDGTVTIRLGRAEDESAMVFLEIADQGPGIPPDRQESVFEEFVRLHPAKSPGSGLGLAISRKIARALGGELSLASEPARGSTFRLLLPTA